MPNNRFWINNHENWALYSTFLLLIGTAIRFVPSGYVNTALNSSETLCSLPHLVISAEMFYFRQF